MSTTDEQRLAFDNDGPPYTLDGMDPLLRRLIVNAVHGAMATKAPPPANHWLTASWEIGRSMTNAVSEPAAPADARDDITDEQIDAAMSAYEALAVPAWCSNRHRPAMAAALRAALARQAAAPAEGK